jgi:hypothetical protein
MAPEQCRGAGGVDHRADIYSLGCILYLMVCARPPFAYEGVGEILGAHLHEPVASPRSVNPEVPLALERIILRALEKAPDRRQQTMAEVARELALLLPNATHSSPAARALTRPPAAAPEGGTTLSGAASERSSAQRPLLRRRAWPIAAAVAGGAVVSAVALRRQQQPAQQPTGMQAAAKPESTVVLRKPEPPVVYREPEPPAVARTPDPELPGVEKEPEPVTGNPAPTTARIPPAGPRTADRGARYIRGVTLLARGQEKEALEAFRVYLRGAGLPPDRRADAERHVVALQRKFGEIEVLCEVTGATVAVDGLPFGRTPLARSILLLPGAHELLVTKDGFKPLRRPFRVAGGERTPFVIRLVR